MASHTSGGQGRQSAYAITSSCLLTLAFYPGLPHLWWPGKMARVGHHQYCPSRPGHLSWPLTSLVARADSQGRPSPLVSFSPWPSVLASYTPGGQGRPSPLVSFSPWLQTGRVRLPGQAGKLLQVWGTNGKVSPQTVSIFQQCFLRWLRTPVIGGIPTKQETGRKEENGASHPGT